MKSNEKKTRKTSKKRTSGILYKTTTKSKTFIIQNQWKKFVKLFKKGW